MEKPERRYNFKEAANLLSQQGKPVSPQLVSKMVESGEIKAITIGKHKEILQSELNKKLYGENVL